ncbi:MAG: S46 family peptidase [Draconibacterium sp.]
MRRLSIYLLVCLFFINQLSAKEGMWIPLFLEKYNIEEMQEMGFKLSARDVYDVNNASMKDAIVMFGRGCTGELISGDGLLITNHHCGYGQIQSHSTVEHDYLTNGFWAMNSSEELPNPGLTVSFLEYMKDVTGEVMKGTESLSDEEIQKEINSNISRIEREANENGKYRTQVKPLFYGNQYFLYVYKVYKDVRLVGAPPSAIGKFGGDTDNWMWPRHTGDFSLFRIYADKNNEPAEYSSDNVPYKPKKFFPISLKGVEPGDFTMVFGNPASTTEYIPSQEVDIIQNQQDPDRIKIRNKKLEIIGAAMEKDAKVRIQYSAKYQSISNAWKKWQGEIKGLQRLDAVNKKLAFENEFREWARQNGRWENEFQPVFNDFEMLYRTYKDYIRPTDYYDEIVYKGVEMFKVAAQLNLVLNYLENQQKDRVEALRKAVMKSLSAFFKDYNQETDEKLFNELIPLLIRDLNAQFLPEEFRAILQKTGQDKLVDKLYRKSILCDSVQLYSILENGTEKQILKLRKDPLIQMYSQLNVKYETSILPVLNDTKKGIAENMKVYMAGIMDMKAGQALYPDANFTLRVTYGKVEGYQPMDGVTYKYYTTLAGIMEKDNPKIYDYDVPEKLKELYLEKDFGRYEVNGDVPVCFTASNHTSGGNSGSPVVNAEGELIGVNFDRVWEGTMSDIMFDPDRCRNISLDIRYALFIIDKFAGAGYLLNEMKIVE